MSETKFLGGLLFAIAFGWAAASNATTVTIPVVSSYPFYQYLGTGDGTVTYDGVTFAEIVTINANAGFFNISPGFSGAPYADVSSQYLAAGETDILITLPSAASAISIDFGTLGGENVTFALSNGQTFTVGSTGSLDYLTPSVFTYSGADFTSVLITSTTEVLNVSQVSFVATPEPAAWAMMLLGFAGVGATLRTRRGHSAAA